MIIVQSSGRISWCFTSHMWCKLNGTRSATKLHPPPQYSTRNKLNLWQQSPALQPSTAFTDCEEWRAVTFIRDLMLRVWMSHSALHRLWCRLPTHFRVGCLFFLVILYLHELQCMVTEAEVKGRGWHPVGRCGGKGGKLSEPRLFNHSCSAKVLMDSIPLSPSSPLLCFLSRSVFLQ